MRISAIAALLALGACSGGGEENKAKARVDALQPGQYEVTSQVTAFRAADQGKPRIDTPQGTRTTRSVCVTDGAALPADLFADEGIDCRPPQGSFVKAGTINISLQCGRPDLQGNLGYTVSGKFDAQSFEVQRQLSTMLVTDGDVVIGSTVTGRRTGECVAAPPAGDAQGVAPAGAAKGK
jgi:hypothetical protein